MDNEKQTVRVACYQANGLIISNFVQGRDEMGAPRLLRDGAGVRLNGPSGTMSGTNDPSMAGGEPGITEVDAVFWAKWVEQNKGKNPLFDNGVIQECTENPTP